MRRLTAVMLILVMLSISVVPAFAEDETRKNAEVYHSQGVEQSAGVEETGVIVSHGVSAGYEVVIPSYIPLFPPEVGVVSDEDGNKRDEITKYNTTEVELGASNVHLPKAKKLTISMNSQNYSGGWKIVSTTNGAQTLNYVITKSETVNASTTSIAPGTSILDCVGGDDNESTKLYFAVTSLPRVGGYYNDLITFTVQVVLINNS